MAQAASRRVPILDEFRGLVIILMILYHLLYDLVFLFGVDLADFFFGPIASGTQIFIATGFNFVAGISSRYSRNNLKRGIQVLGLGLAISLITWLFMRDQMIWFGVLHLLGSSMILFGLLRPALDKVPAAPGALVFLLLFLLTYTLPRGYLSFFGLFRLDLPPALYNYPFLLPLGFGGAGSDYFPLIPWLFLFLSGTFIGQYFLSGRIPAFFYRSHCPPLAAAGRHSLIIYAVHQPLLYAVLTGVFHFLPSGG